MLITVRYHDGKCDCVRDSATLDRFIASGLIREFYRQAEKKWVVIGRDPARGTGGVVYKGPERRKS